MLYGWLLLSDGAAAGAEASRLLLDLSSQLIQHVPHGRDDLTFDGIKQLALALAAKAEPLLPRLEADLVDPAPRIEPDDLLVRGDSVCADEGDELAGPAPRFVCENSEGASSLSSPAGAKAASALRRLNKILGFQTALI